MNAYSFNLLEKNCQLFKTHHQWCSSLNYHAAKKSFTIDQISIMVVKLNWPSFGPIWRKQITSNKAEYYTMENLSLCWNYWPSNGHDTNPSTLAILPGTYWKWHLGVSFTKHHIISRRLAKAPTDLSMKY